MQVRGSERRRVCGGRVDEVVEAVAAAAVHRGVRVCIGGRGVRVSIGISIGGGGGSAGGTGGGTSGGGGGRAGDAEAVETVLAGAADQSVLPARADVVHALHVRAVQQNVRMAQRVSRTDALPANKN